MNRDWSSCDGLKRAEEMRAIRPSRRDLIAGIGFGLAAWAGTDSALADLSISRRQKDLPHDVLVTIFLRGGADGLNAIVPYAEDAYYRSRPNLSIAAPNDSRSGTSSRILDLNGFFGLHPALSPLLPIYRDGKLAILHACGSQDGTRSHFEAMAAVERGLAAEGPGPTSGWIARHLASTEGPEDSPLRAVAFGGTLPDSLRGASNTVALESLTDFQLNTPDDKRAHFEKALLGLYSQNKDEVAHAGRETLAVLNTLRQIDPAQYKPSHGASYPETDLGRGMRQTACLIRANLGLEVAALDRGGWDTHYAQGSTVGILSLSLDDLGRSLAAFSTDLGGEMSHVTVVVMTEFGRRLAENSGLGTDHGRASFMLLMGGGTKGGQVHAKWPGLEPHQLDETGDLRVTTDYRDVLCEVLANRMRNERLSDVFVNYNPQLVGLVQPIG
jgi:uncharacterized protein (DUF1501 family)